MKNIKKKKEISIVRSSAAEYLTFITATGKSYNMNHFRELCFKDIEYRLIKYIVAGPKSSINNSK